MLALNELRHRFIQKLKLFSLQLMEPANSQLLPKELFFCFARHITVLIPQAPSAPNTQLNNLENFEFNVICVHAYSCLSLRINRFCRASSKLARLDQIIAMLILLKPDIRIVKNKRFYAPIVLFDSWHVESESKTQVL